jgi:transcriptional regulator with XRE-family HTH domain
MRLIGLRNARLRAGLSQEALAEKMYTRQSYISRVEQGNSVSRNWARRTADVLGVPVEDLLDPEIGQTLKALRK